MLERDTVSLRRCATVHCTQAPQAARLQEKKGVGHRTDTREGLRIGSIELASPVVLALMAGVTNVAFRTLLPRTRAPKRPAARCRDCTCEMVTARALERHPVTMHMTTVRPEENPWSMQRTPSTRVQSRRGHDDRRPRTSADHIDMNFGCPVPKVTPARAVRSAIGRTRKPFP